MDPRVSLDGQINLSIKRKNMKTPNGLFLELVDGFGPLHDVWLGLDYLTESEIDALRSLPSIRCSLDLNTRKLPSHLLNRFIRETNIENFDLWQETIGVDVLRMISRSDIAATHLHGRIELNSRTMPLIEKIPDLRVSKLIVKPGS